MASSRSSLLLASLFCVGLVGCPKVTELKGTAFVVSDSPAGVVDSGLEQGANLEEGATIRVEPGSSVTIEFDDNCSHTYRPGTHTVTNPCAADEDSEDLDQDDDHRDDNDKESRDDRTRSNETTPQSQGPAQAGVLQSSALATAGVVLGTVVGIIAITEATADDNEGPPPLSP